jgi:hypothetical protein
MALYRRHYQRASRIALGLRYLLGYALAEEGSLPD